MSKQNDKDTNILIHLIPVWIMFGIMSGMTYVVFNDIDCDKFVTMTDDEYSEFFASELFTKEQSTIKCNSDMEVVSYVFWSIPIVLSISTIIMIRLYYKDKNTKYTK